MSTGFLSGFDRFQLRFKLGQGGMGVVYRAYDRELGRDVALKTLATVDADAIYRFKREFRSLAELSHPNLITLYEMFFEQDTWFFTMELLDGMNFLSYVSGAQKAAEEATAGSGPQNLATNAVESETGEGTDPTHRKNAGVEEHTQPKRSSAPPEEGTQPKASGAELAAAPAHPVGFVPARLYDALKQLTKGLQALHDAGKEHRDLKPANVFVTHEGRLVLLDFGLALDRSAKEFYADQSEITSSSGTPAYMAPERHLGESPGAPSDWYSLGVMLYETLAGVKPYVRLSEVVKGLPPADPRERNPDAPADLAQLAMDLLHRDPARRPRGPEILARLTGSTGRLAAVPSKVTGDVALVGREPHLQMLERAFDLRAREGTVQVRVQGKSGFGKTALIQHFLQGLIANGRAVVLAGRCYERESVPFKVFDSVIDALARYLNTLKPEEAAALLPADVKVLTRLFPALLRVAAVEKAPEPSAELKDVLELGKRAAQVLKALFNRVAERRPLVLYVDDLQWGDVDSSHLLADLLSKPPPQVMLVVSYRSEDLSGRVLTQLLDATQKSGIRTETLEVGPLSTSESTALAQRMVGSALGANADRITQEAAGSPFFVQQLSQYVAAAPEGMQQGQKLTLADVLRANMTQLQGPSLELLTTVAVAGRPMARGLIARAASLSEHAVEAFGGLRAGNWVRVTGPRTQDTVEVYHDKIRETLIGDLPAERLQGIHRSLAEVLEGEATLDAEALTSHWLGAGEAAKASKYALLAAKNAAQSLAFDRAAELYQIALETLAEGTEDHRAATFGLADALKNASRGPEAAEAYLKAAGLAKDADERLEMERLAFEQYLVSGYLEKGRDLARNVLRSVGLPLPSGRAGIVVSLLIQRARVRLRGRKFAERAANALPKELKNVTDVCWSMALGLSLVDNKLGSLYTARYVRLALEGGDPERIARGLSLEAAHQGGGASFKLAEQLIAEAEALAERCASPHASALVAQNRGWVEYFQGRYRRALELYDSSSSTLRTKCSGVSWEIATAQMMANWSLLYLGEWDELYRRHGVQMAEAKRTGDLYRIDGLGICAGVISALMDDDVPRVRAEVQALEVAWNPTGFQLQHFFRLLMGGFIDLYAGEPERYWPHLMEQWAPLEGSLLMTVVEIKYRMHMIRALAAVSQPDSPQMRKQALRSAKILAGIPSTGSKGFAGTVRAALLARDGQKDAAAVELRGAIEDYDRAGMALLKAAAEWRLGELFPNEQSRARTDAARVLMQQRGIHKPERMLRVLAPGFPE